jgi:copper oxidase (laccase) domain-containing protein
LESQLISIIDESRCTLENDDLYSYRRDGVTGRQAGIISL